MPDEFSIDAGELRFLLEIQAVTKPKDGKGQPKPDWSTIDTRWASIKPASGQYFVAAEEIRNKTSHKIIMRYFAGLTPKHRIRYRGRIFNILSVLNEGELNVRYTVLAEEVIA